MLDYDTEGDRSRETLVLLHSGGMSKREWEPYRRGLARHFHLVVPSAPGHGRSPNVEPFNITSFAGELRALLDSLQLPRVHLLGSSMGGATALAFALREPARVDKLILFRASYCTRPETRAATLAMGDPETWRHWGLARWMEEEHRPQGGDQAWRALARRVSRMLLEPDSGREHTLEELRGLRASTLLIAGDRDPVVPLDDVVEMYRAIPSCALWIVPSATHFLGTDGWRLPAFEAEVVRFLNRRLPPRDQAGQS